MMLGIRCYQYSSTFWHYTLGGHLIAWFAPHFGYHGGLGCYMDDDNEEFTWRSDFERHLLNRLQQDMTPALEAIIDHSRSNPRLDALTSGSNRGIIAASPCTGARRTREEEAMAKKLMAADIEKMTLPQLREAASKVFDEDDVKSWRKAQLIEELKDYYSEDEDEEPEEDDELDDDDEELDDEEDDEEEEDDEVDEPASPAKKSTTKPTSKGKVNDSPADHKADTKRQTPPEPNGDTLTAKQVATRIGTDAKTLRKFFRSAASTVDAVGQGGRYEFKKSDLAKIQKEFDTWKANARGRGRPASNTEGSKAKPAKGKAAPVEEIDDEELELDPDDDELEELEDEELDLDDDELDE